MKIKHFRQFLIKELPNNFYSAMDDVLYLRRLAVDFYRGSPQPFGIYGGCDGLACFTIGYFLYPCKNVHPTLEKYPFSHYRQVQQALMRPQNRHILSHTYNLTETLK